MVNSKAKETGKKVWSQVSFDEKIAAIASLGDRTDQLKNETWRLNVKTRSPDSLLGEIIDKLNLDHNEKTRHCLYDFWHKKCHIVHKLVEKKKRLNNDFKNDGNDGVIDKKEEISVPSENNLILSPDPSLPLPQRPNTRANQKQNANSTKNKDSFVGEISLVLNGSEWKNAFSRTDQKMKPEWTHIFNNKLTPSIIQCSLRFKSPHIRKGKRKKNCRIFFCVARCTIGLCERKYHIILKNQPDNYSSVLFLVQIYGKEDHNIDNGTSRRHLAGVDRFIVGKRANEIGPVAMFREKIEAADEKLLAAGNYTGCETIPTIKKAAADYRKVMHIDEEVFKECRIIARAYRKEDVDSEHVEGYIHVVGEIPLRIHMFSEHQIKRYIRYCKIEKYSFVHLDATGGILKKMREQNQSLLYAIMFKDGTDSINTIPLAHAVLTDNTVPSINYFLGNVAYNIAEVNKKLILPSFFIIDFSAAIMNAILQTFNVETINTHLNRCWNVLCGKYDAKQLRSLSFIHLCCCHVIHAIARSLNAAHIDKKIRRGILHIFAYMLCSNDMKELYDTLGLVINIFGDPNEQNAKEKFEQIISLKLNADEESISILTDDKKILKKAKKNNDELKLVDEYFHSNAPIIHQSPFNEEAIRLYPNLHDLIKKKSTYDKIVNPLFSPAVIRIFYRWWAYLPLWTGLLFNFEERFASNIKSNLSLINNPIRYSNAVIESYFRTLKKSIYQGKVNNRPSEVIMELYRSVRVQFKALKFHVTQSSKGRKRRKKNVTDKENWGKRPTEKKYRNIYLKHMVDKFASKRARSQIDEIQSDIVMKKISESEDTTTASSLNRSISSSEDLNDNVSLNSSRSRENKSTSFSSKSNSVVDNEYPTNDRVVSDKWSVDDDVESKVPIEYNFDTNTMSSITDTLYPVAMTPLVTIDQASKTPHSQRSSHPEIIIDGHILRWPKFEIKNTVFEGQSYTLILTCPIDSALFALYFLYRTSIDISAELDSASEASPYSTLVKIFRLVEKEGWDTARISWLLNFHLLKRNDRQPKSLFGSVDEQVFCFLKDYQRHSNTITCTNLQCTDKERKYSTTELRIFPCDDYIEKFEAETMGTCGTMIKRYDEMTEEVALANKYRNGRVPYVNYETNETGYIHAWVCDRTIISSEAFFDYGHPPIIIVNIEPFSKRGEEGYEPNPVRLRDMKRIIRISSVKYELRAVIHNKNAHFTATLLGSDKKLYIYDDQKGVREVRNSTDPVEFGLYSQIYEF